MPASSPPINRHFAYIDFGRASDLIHRGRADRATTEIICGATVTLASACGYLWGKKNHPYPAFMDGSRLGGAALGMAMGLVMGCTLIMAMLFLKNVQLYRECAAELMSMRKKVTTLYRNARITDQEYDLFTGAVFRAIARASKVELSEVLKNLNHPGYWLDKKARLSTLSVKVYSDVEMLEHNDKQADTVAQMAEQYHQYATPTAKVTQPESRFNQLQRPF